MILCYCCSLSVCPSVRQPVNFVYISFQGSFYRDPFGSKDGSFPDEEEVPYVGYMYPRTGAYNNSIPSTFIPGENLLDGTHNPYLYNDTPYDNHLRRDLPISNL